MAAYEYVLEAKVRHHRSKREENEKAQELIVRAIELDPKYAHAHAWKACILGQQWVYGWSTDADATRSAIERELEIALALDENDSDVQRVLAALRLTQRNHEKAFFHQQRALHLNPNDDLIVVQQGEILTWLGRAEEGVPWIQKAMRLNPFHPPRFWKPPGARPFRGPEVCRGGRSLQADRGARCVSPRIPRGLPCAAWRCRRGERSRQGSPEPESGLRLERRARAPSCTTSATATARTTAMPC
jgi:tetratricopeptide (TPR) repeat protein